MNRPLSPQVVEFYRDRLALAWDDMAGAESDQERWELAGVMVTSLLRLVGVP